MHKELCESEIEEIKKQARIKLGECRKLNDIIGNQIFSILGLYARVIYYPLGDTAPWGFTRISGSKNDAGLEKPFVAINTSIPLDCQVFAGAHELFHIWYDKKPDVLPADLLHESDNELEEKKANRFAAEFLVDEVMLKQEMDLYKIKKISVKSILQLSDLFTVPYIAMTKRLRETGVINAQELKQFLSESDETIEKYRKCYAFQTKKADHRIAMDNLVELSVNAYRKGYITFEKFEYLLSLSDMTPDELGIIKKTDDSFPSDEELQSIMEE